MRNSFLRGIVALVVIGLSGLLISGCGKSDPFDGKVYHGAGGAPITIEFKGGKAKVELMGDTKTLDYKVEDDKVTIINKADGDLVLNRHPDGTLTSVLGELKAN